MTDLGTQWDAVAVAWDERADDVDRQTSPATQALVRAADVRAGDRVLELACGPGTLARTWADGVGPSGAVVLSDVSPAMVDAARRRCGDLPNVEVAVLDASAIDRPDSSFDVVVMQMGLMFTPDPAAALREIRRVLVPSGRVAVLTWGAMEKNPWMTCVGMAAMTNGVDGLVLPFLPGGPFSLGDPAALAALVTDAGFDGVATSEIDVAFEAPDPAAHVERVLALAGPLSGAVEAAPDEVRAAVRRSAAELLAPHVRADGGVRVPGVAVLVSGQAGSRTTSATST